MLTNKLKINIFGEGWRLKQLVLSEMIFQTFEETAIKMKLPLAQAITNPFFYHYLKNKTIQTIDDLEGITTEGLLNSPKNQLEIWFKNRKIQKLKINDLNEKLLLFPLYCATTKMVNLSLEKGIYIEQKEIGLIGSFEIIVDNFKIDDLEFQLLQTNELMILEKLIYKDQVLVNKKKDSLITYQHCFEIE